MVQQPVALDVIVTLVDDQVQQPKKVSGIHLLIPGYNSCDIDIAVFAGQISVD